MMHFVVSFFVAARLPASMMNLASASRLLEVPVGASRTVVRAAYRRMAARSHPDVTSGNTQDFLELQLAYETCLRYSVTASKVHTPEVRPNPHRQVHKQQKCWQPFVARRENVDQELCSAWDAYWSVALAKRYAAEKAEVQRIRIMVLKMKLQSSTESEFENSELNSKLQEAEASLSFLIRRHASLDVQATDLESQAQKISCCRERWSV